VKNSVLTLWRDERGSEMLEWAVVTAVLLSATVIIILNLQDEILTFFQDLFNTLQDPPPADFLGNSGAPPPTALPPTPPTP
jgi:Flp pilus assembly pilin Flp